MICRDPERTGRMYFNVPSEPRWCLYAFKGGQFVVTYWQGARLEAW